MNTLGKYKIVEELGQGGMGTVYKAYDPVIERDVAIKVISRQYINDPDSRRRFYREARSAGRLSHPNVTIIHDIGEEGGYPYIVMELLEGKDLRHHIQQGTLSLSQKLRAALQVAQGLHYAHRHNVIHRDIKPDNVYILETGRVKVLDFGIARLESDTQTMTNASIGTPKYMAPEQIEGRDIDHRADIFSFGVLLYEMLTGVNPFSADNITATIYKVLHGQPEALHIEAGPIQGALQAFVLKCLEKRPENRYTDFGAVIGDLEGIIARYEGDTLPLGEEAPKRPVAHASVASRADTVIAPKRSWAVPALGAFGLLAVLAAGGLFLFRGGFESPLGEGQEAASEQEVAAALNIPHIPPSLSDSVAVESVPQEIEEADLIGLLASVDRQRQTMQSQLSRADQFGGRGEPAYELAETRRTEADALYEQGDREALLRAWQLYAEAERGYMFAADAAETSQRAARAEQRLVEAERRAAELERRAADPSPASRQRQAESPATTVADPPPAQNPTSQPPVTSPSGSTNSPTTSTSGTASSGAQPQAGSGAAPALPSSGFGVSGAGRAVNTAPADQARSTMRTAKGNVGSSAQGDVRYRLARSLEERGDTAYGAKRYDRAEQFFNWARRLYSTANVASLPENALQVGLDDMTAIYREALHQRDMQALQAIFSNFTSRDERVWQQFIDQGGGVTIYTSTANIKISGDGGTADVALHLDYSDPQQSLHRSVLNYSWELKKTGQGWIVTDMKGR